jgi:plasmid stabilization system protein ParE
MKIFWSAQALCDLRAIRDFIARDSEHYARLRPSHLSRAGGVWRDLERPAHGFDSFATPPPLPLR